MDVTPQVINEVEFHQKMRGYDPDEVDDFLERVAVAVAELHDRLRDAADRAVAAERRAAEAESVATQQAKPDADAAIEAEAETIKRTLILAQRTADAAIKEAEEAAGQTLATAQERAEKLLGEAQERSRRMVADAEAEARRTADETRQRLVQEIIELEESRDALRADHGILDRHLEEQRLRLRSTIGELQRLVDDPSRLRAGGLPQTAGAERPPLVDAILAEGSEAADGSEAPEAAGSDNDVMIDLAVAGAGAAKATPPAGRVVFTGAEDDATEAADPIGEPIVGDRAAEDEAWARFVGADAEPQGTGPATAPHRLVDGDAYQSVFADDGSVDTLEADAPTRSRFGRRR